jgi:hypothetical protein
VCVNCFCVCSTTIIIHITIIIRVTLWAAQPFGRPVRSADSPLPGTSTCCLPSAVCCLLPTVRCLLSAVCCLLSAVCCLPSFVVCLPCAKFLLTRVRYICSHTHTHTQTSASELTAVLLTIGLEPMGLTTVSAFTDLTVVLDGNCAPPPIPPTHHFSDPHAYKCSKIGI